MAKRELAPRRRRLSLSFRISVWLMFAALFPLIITVASSELQSRPSLINQANIAMESDVSTRVQLIDTYFTERLLDAATLTQVPTVQAFLALSPEKETKDLITRTGYTLAAGAFRDKNYGNWSLFDTQSRLRLYYPGKPQPHGLNLVPPEDLQTVLSGKEFITPVYCYCTAGPGNPAGHQQRATLRGQFYGACAGGQGNHRSREQQARADHAPDDACRTKPDFPGGMAQNVGASLDLFCVEPAQYGDGSCRQADVYHDHCCGCSTVFCHARRLLAGATNHTTYSKFG